MHTYTHCTVEQEPTDTHFLLCSRDGSNKSAGYLLSLSDPYVQVRCYPSTRPTPRGHCGLLSPTQAALSEQANARQDIVKGNVWFCFYYCFQTPHLKEKSCHKENWVGVSITTRVSPTESNIKQLAWFCPKLTFEKTQLSLLHFSICTHTNKWDTILIRDP